MASKPFRLLHAANLQLDCPLRGVGSVQDEIREIVDTATLVAFDRLINFAMEKDVDALLVTGNTFDAQHPSLAAEVAMRDGFERLAEKSIPVFVVPGELDPASAWMDLPRLPENVTLFIDGDDTPVDITDHGHLLATIFPVSASTSIEPEELSNILGGRTNSKGDRPFVVGMLLTEHDVIRQERSKMNPNRFAALDWLVCPTGTDADSMPLTDGQVHAQSAPQGMSAAETGSHGVTILEVDAHRNAKHSLLNMAPVRWEKIVQPIDRVKNRDELLERMLAQLERLPSHRGELVRIVDWKLDRTSGDAHGWEQESAAKELAAAITELSDQPDGLRYVHRVEAVDPDLTLIEPAQREVLTEYLLALGRRAPNNPGAFAKWIADARVEGVLNQTDWEQWTDSITTEMVADRAQKLGWKWFAEIGKK